MCGKSETKSKGRVVEWFKAPVLKTGVGATPPRVRIPPLPPFNISFNEMFFYLMDENPSRGFVHE